MSSQRAKRFNQNKVDLTLLPSVACHEEAKVWMAGEQKYGRDNWKALWGEQTVEVVMASLMRHAFAITSGELFDSETGLPHAANIRCNAAMILEWMEREGLINPKVYSSPVDKEVSSTNYTYEDVQNFIKAKVKND